MRRKDLFRTVDDRRSAVSCVVTPRQQSAHHATLWACTTTPFAVLSYAIASSFAGHAMVETTRSPEFMMVPKSMPNGTSVLLSKSCRERLQSNERHHFSGSVKIASKQGNKRRIVELVGIQIWVRTQKREWCNCCDSTENCRHCAGFKIRQQHPLQEESACSCSMFLPNMDLPNSNMLHCCCT